MTLTFHGLWLVCALGAAVFAAGAAGRARDLAVMAAAFVAAVLAASPVALPDAAMVSAAAAAAAAVYLFRPRLAFLTAACGGALAGVLAVLLQAQALPPFVAVAAAAALLAVSAWLARTRPRFAPEILLDEGMLAIGVLAIAVAVLPGVLDGWHAAANLTAAAGERGAAMTVPPWVLVVLATSVSLGAVHSLWSRR